MKSGWRQITGDHIAQRCLEAFDVAQGRERLFQQEHTRYAYTSAEHLL
jgi:hypothetical protein